jgi:hypothetical protein
MNTFSPHATQYRSDAENTVFDAHVRPSWVTAIELESTLSPATHTAVVGDDAMLPQLSDAGSTVCSDVQLPGAASFMTSTLTCAPIKASPYLAKGKS